MLIQIYKVDDGYVVSENGIWVMGVYDERETAFHATTLPDHVLFDLNERICHVDGENRVITMDDLLAANEKGEG